MPRSTRFRSRLFLLATLALVAVATAKDVVENDDDGKPHLKYQVDLKNRKSGDYAELFPSGKVKIHGSYQADKKTGTWITNAEDGKIVESAHYNNDVLEGAYQYNFPNGHTQFITTYTNGEINGPVTAYDEKGVPLFTVKYPMTKAAVQKAVDTWAPADRSGPKMKLEPKVKAPYEAGEVSAESQEAGLKYLQLYRLLSNLPTKMAIDPTLADKAQHGAVLLHDVGHLSHTPDRPEDMDPGFYKIGYSGTSTGNIAQGMRDLFSEIDAYMNDSDKSNIDRVGHRQWILMPGLQKTGFGYADGFSTLNVFDGADHSNAGFAFIAYPGEGYYPKFMIADDAAWSLSLNTAGDKMKLDKKILAIKVTAVDEHFGVIESATAEIVNIQPCPAGGIFPCIIYKPGLKQKGVGKYVVQVTGIKNQSNQPQPLVFMVDIVDIHPVGEAKKQDRHGHHSDE